MTLSFFSVLAFFFALSFVTCQEEDFLCTRLVTEKRRCEVYNYRHPLCKKWDRSQCPPPHIIRDSSPCVSYKCVRKVNGEKLEPPAWPVQQMTTVKTIPTTKSEKVGLEEEDLSLSEAELKIDSLQSQLTNLQRVLEIY